MTEFLSNNPLITIGIVVVAVAFFFFFLFRFIKWILIMSIAVLVVTGFLYYVAPDDYSGTVKKTMEQVKDSGGKAMEQGRDLVGNRDDIRDAMKGILSQGREVTRCIKELVSSEKKDKTKKDTTED